MAKKKFDKKNAQKFVLMPRVGGDKSGDGQSNMVLQPANEAGYQYMLEHEDTMMNFDGEEESKVQGVDMKKTVGALDAVDEWGYTSPDYDYSQHMRPILPGGTFITPECEVVKTDTIIRDVKVDDDDLDADCPLDAPVEAVAVTEDFVPADMRKLLENDEDILTDNEEDSDLEDDFIMAATKPTNEDFDFEEHVNKLLGRHRHVDNDDDDNFSIDSDERELFEYIHQQRREEDRAGGVMASEERLDYTMDQYADEHIGDLEGDERAVGKMSSNDPAFLDMLQEDIDMEEEEIDERNQRIMEEDEKNETLRMVDNMPHDETPAQIEEALDEHTEKMSQAPKLQYDCQSIQSQLSRFDNQPRTIGARRHIPNKQNLRIDEQIAEESDSDSDFDEDDLLRRAQAGVSFITLSNKTGMPLNVLPVKAKKEKSGAENKGVKRNKKESKEDKKARKALEKERKRERRAQKKASKDAFKSEENRMSRVCAGNRQGQVVRPL
eukprot:TRINITY_DN3426_c0_g1_i1.p1 TRINITY_DN3426_c0_g1~~TRINITY_DN3426_c0_g1_i1.p1  ORF type:complete len:494 (+),score=189.34 TRINITY_DN3426_c0_g1_i1:146-1627(+)